VDFDLRRSPPAALAALRYVEELAHRVKTTVVGTHKRSDPVTWLIRTHRSIHRDGDAALIRRAYVVAEELHQGQMRKSGEPYITHPLAVAQILAELGMDTTTLVAALLHDTVEDTSYTMEQLRAHFGGEVALLVDGVTKFDRVFYGESAEVETIRKMIIKAGSDVRVLVVKLADRLHNMLTIDARSVASRMRIARATQDVLIPLCDKLGIQWLKRQLEDSVLAALEPEAHTVLRSYVAHRPEWTTYTDGVIAQTKAVMRAARIPAEVVARPRHLYSIWRDTFGRGHNSPYELPRIAIIVKGPDNACYTALGAVHSTWRPVAGRFKDFIGSPKNNLYRSLHTTVIGPDSRAVEVLIRTEAMHRNVEYGIAAAFRFARRGPGAHSARGRTRDRATGGVNEETRSHLDWLYRLVEWQREAVHPERFIESLRCDLAEGQVFVFVDSRRLLLPAGSTPVDVAYRLGPEIGDRCIAATVNGQLTFLSSPLTDGDVVEIHTAGPDETSDADGQPIGPSPEWLTFVRTPHAQLHIERRLGLQVVDDDPERPTTMPVASRVRIGRSAIGLELRLRGRGLASDLPLVALAGQLGYPDTDSLLIAVADHTVSAADIAKQLINEVDGGSVEAAVAASAPTRKP
jgi:guanosine-3',5'-bis(diphosphate) 3'-pyrophosphohydrolase